jgi:threonine dehydrogenase-like Zn-dependent dehydrogenase
MDRIRDNVKLADLITHTYPFEKINDAFKKSIEEKAEVIKVMILINS